MESAAASSSDAGRLCEGKNSRACCCFGCSHTTSGGAARERVKLVACRSSALTFAWSHPGGCGFFGSPQLNFYCSVCFKKTHGEEEFKRRTTAMDKKEHGSAAGAGGSAQKAEPATTQPSTAAESKVEGGARGAEQSEAAEKQPARSDESSAPATAGVEQSAQAAGQASKQGGAGGAAEEGAEPASKKMAPSRCISCKKKVGLLGFNCRCGGTFCEKHRYSDKHECTFDYKTHGRTEVTALPVERVRMHPGLAHTFRLTEAVQCAACQNEPCVRSGKNGQDMSVW